MTQVTVLVFGPLRDRLGVREVAAQGATVSEVWDDLTRQFPSASVITGIRPALNLTYCDWSAPVSSGDTVAFLPPVAGGSGAEPTTEAVHVAIVEEPIDVAAVMELAGRGDGAVAVFVGRVRDNSDGHAVSRIEYEVYREMAEREMRAIATSLLVSLSTTPMLCAQFLKSRDAHRHGAIYRASERAFQWLHAEYASALRWVLRHQVLILCIAIGTAARGDIQPMRRTASRANS